MLQHAPTRYNTLQHAATHYNTMQHNATHCNTHGCFFNISTFLPLALHCEIEITVTRCNMLQHAVSHYNTLQHAATRCNTLQHTATHLVDSSISASTCRWLCTWRLKSLPNT